jgi:hypothetical protein
MKKNQYGMALAVKEHLHSGQSITRLEALILFGVSDLTKVISDLRKEGWTVQSRSVPFAAAVKRVNEFAVVQPPANLPIREIQLTEYWMEK